MSQLSLIESFIAYQHKYLVRIRYIYTATYQVVSQIPDPMLWRALWMIRNWIASGSQLAANTICEAGMTYGTMWLATAAQAAAFGTNWIEWSLRVATYRTYCSNPVKRYKGMSGCLRYGQQLLYHEDCVKAFLTTTVTYSLSRSCEFIKTPNCTPVLNGKYSPYETRKNPQIYGAWVGILTDTGSGYWNHPGGSWI